MPNEDFNLIVKHIHHSGDTPLPMRSVEYATAWSLADGFGKCTAEQAQKRGFFGDWSHFRDSSETSIARVANYLRAFERSGNKLSGHTREVDLFDCQF